MFILEGLESRDGSFLLLLPPHHYPALSSQQGLGRGLADQQGRGTPASLTLLQGLRQPPVRQPRSHRPLAPGLPKPPSVTPSHLGIWSGPTWIHAPCFQANAAVGPLRSAFPSFPVGSLSSSRCPVMAHPFCDSPRPPGAPVSLCASRHCNICHIRGGGLLSARRRPRLSELSPRVPAPGGRGGAWTAC